MAVLTAQPADWSTLDWAQLQDKNPERNIERRSWALQVLNNLLEGHNTAIDAATGGGKTIMAVLIHIALKRNTLLVVPTVELARWHKDLFHKLLGRRKYARVMTGSKLPEKRAKVWQEFVEHQGKIVIATPHTIINDIKCGLFPLGYFSLLIIDEFHHAHKKYPYVPLALAAYKAGSLILSLSATAKDLEALKNCFVGKIVNVVINMPPKIVKTLVAKPTDNLKEVSDNHQKLLEQTINELIELKLIPDGTKLLTKNDLKKLANFAAQPSELLPDPKHKIARSIIGRYGYLNYLQRVLKVCSYHNFIEGSDKLLQKDRQFAKWILNNFYFQNILKRVRKISDTEPHPKVEMLTKAVAEKVDSGKNFITFVNEQNTARIIANEISKLNIPVDFMIGGRSEKYHRKEIISKLFSRELKGVVVTPVGDEGLSLPDMDIAFMYGRNYTEVQKNQRSGRVGRGNEPGEIYSVLLDDPIEWVMERKLKTKQDQTTPEHNRPVTQKTPDTLWLPFPIEDLPTNKKPPPQSNNSYESFNILKREK